MKIVNDDAWLDYPGICKRFPDLDFENEAAFAEWFGHHRNRKKKIGGVQYYRLLMLLKKIR